jgi:hypothetical protein
MDRRTFTSGLGAMAANGIAGAQPMPGAAPPIDGWLEAVALVANLERASAFWRDIARWEDLGTRRTPREVLDYWGLALPRVRARERLFRAPDATRGMVRLIEVQGISLLPGRASAMPWDTGGIFSVMARTRNLEAMLYRLPALGLTSFSDPYDLTFGGRTLRNAVIRSPDGAHVAVYERVNDDSVAPASGGLARPFNSMQMVKSRDTTEAWFAGLGYQSLLRGTFIDPTPTATNFNVPRNLSTSVPRHYAIMVPQGAETEHGRVELMQFEGIEGTDRSARTRVPALGWLTLVFPATAPEGVIGPGKEPVFRSRGDSAVSFGTAGLAKAVTLVTPDGALMTFASPP